MRQSISDNPWFAYYRPRPAARARLFCLPYAGGGAALFREWQDSLPEAVEAVPVQLPGRETRFCEAPVFDLPRLADTLAANLTPWLDRPFALFGHSMGALLAFEIARRLRDRNQPDPTYLFASACAAPQLCRQGQAIHRLPDGEFLRELRRLNGTPAAVFDQPELMELLLPMLRADFALCETYTYQVGRPLRCPVMAIGGLHDESTPLEQLQGWQQQTVAEFSLRLLPGGHFFLRSAATALLRTLGERLLSAAPVHDVAGAWHAPAEPWPLRPHEVHIWRFGLDQPAEVRAALWQHLSSAERARAKRFHFRRDQDRFIAGRGILRLILGYCLAQSPGSVQLSCNAQGKPRLAGRNTGGIRFNLAHTRGLALVAVSRNREVGVDLELVRSDIAMEEIAARFFSPYEQASLAAVPAVQRQQAFFNCWTRKEAYLKAIGKGLTRALDSFDMSLAPGQPPALLEDREDNCAVRRWAIHHLQPAPDYVGAVAAEGQHWHVRHGDWPSLPLAVRHSFCGEAHSPTTLAETNSLVVGGY